MKVIEKVHGLSVRYCYYYYLCVRVQSEQFQSSFTPHFGLNISGSLMERKQVTKTPKQRVGQIHVQFYPCLIWTKVIQMMKGLNYKKKYLQNIVKGLIDAQLNDGFFTTFQICWLQFSSCILPAFKSELMDND